jgi:drug/metabolite transporter (DMT)-like permease
MQVPTGFEVLSLVILTLGVVLSIWEGSIAGSPSGICIAVASTFCGAAMLSFSGKVRRLSRGNMFWF